VRAVGWKISLIAIVLCYPVPTALGRLMTWLLLLLPSSQTARDQAQMLRVGNLVSTGVGILIWLVAVIGALEPAGEEDATEYRLRKFALLAVGLATLAFLGGFVLRRQILAA